MMEQVDGRHTPEYLCDFWNGFCDSIKMYFSTHLSSSAGGWETVAQMTPKSDGSLT